VCLLISFFATRLHLLFAFFLFVEYLTMVLWYVLISYLRSCVCRYDKGHAYMQILPSYVNYESFFSVALYAVWFI
jgi:hypothetical protein